MRKLILILLLFPIILAAQDYKIAWYSMNSGFSASNDNEIVIKSVVGQAIIGSDMNEKDSHLESGFLVDDRIKNIVIVGVDEINNLSNLSSSPNPFSNNLRLEFNLKAPSIVKIEYFSNLGDKIFVYNAGNLPAGHNEIVWDGNDSNGKEIIPGIYYYKLIFEENNQLKYQAGKVIKH